MPAPRRTHARLVAAGAVVAAAGALVLFDHVVRELEASTSAHVLAVVGLHAAPLRSAVVFPVDGRLVGYALSAGCSVAFLLSPLYLVIAGLLAAGRLSVRRGIACVVVLTALLFTVNQLRLAVIAWSMRAWGFETGYARSHVFLGTLVSTLGVLGGLLIVLRQMTHQRREVAVHA